MMISTCVSLISSFSLWSLFLIPFMLTCIIMIFLSVFTAVFLSLCCVCSYVAPLFICEVGDRNAGVGDG